MDGMRGELPVARADTDWIPGPRKERPRSAAGPSPRAPEEEDDLRSRADSCQCLPLYDPSAKGRAHCERVSSKAHCSQGGGLRQRRMRGLWLRSWTGDEKSTQGMVMLGTPHQRRTSRLRCIPTDGNVRVHRGITKRSCSLFYGVASSLWVSATGPWHCMVSGLNRERTRGQKRLVLLGRLLVPDTNRRLRHTTLSGRCRAPSLQYANSMNADHDAMTSGSHNLAISR